MWERRSAYRALEGNLRGIDHVEYLGVDERIILRWIFGKYHWGDLGLDGWIILGWISRRWDVGIWTGLGWPTIQTGGGRL